MNKQIKQFIATMLLITVVCQAASAQWGYLGGAGFSQNDVDYVDMAMDNRGYVYVAYTDNGNSGKVTVDKWDGNNWSSMGVVSQGAASYVTIDINQSSNRIYVGYQDHNQGGKATVMGYNGSYWSVLQKYGFTSSSVTHTSIDISPNGEIYLAYADNNQSGKVTVSKFSKPNRAWFNYGGSAGISSGSVQHVSLSVNSNEYAVVAYSDNNHNNKLNVKGSSGSGWSTIGYNISNNEASHISGKFDPDDNYYVIYRDNGYSNKAIVKKRVSSSWSSVGSSSGISASGVAYCDIGFTEFGNPVVVYRDQQGSSSSTNKATVLKYRQSAWENIGSQQFTNGGVEYTSIAVDPCDNVYIAFQDLSVSNKASAMKYTSQHWDGSSSTDWNTAANWSRNSVPTSSEDVCICAGMNNYPVTSTQTYLYTRDISIKIGASVTLNHSSARLRTYGDFRNEGTFSASKGRLSIYGSNEALVSSTHSLEIDEFRVKNNNGCVLQDSVKIVDKLLPSSGTLYTNDKLVLLSTANNTARVDDRPNGGSGYIVGDVTVQRYIPGGRRVWRFFSHPFSSSIKLSQLMDDIDITGNGGSANGFTTVAVNNPSAYWFDVTTADTTTVGNNPGWKAFTSANTASWDRYEMARIFVRGSKGQGLTQGSYTPNPVTIDMTGPVNQGTQQVYLPKGDSSDFVICGNPYPAQINLANINRSNNMGANFCVWDANQGTRGGYTAHQFSSNYYLPVGGAFVSYVTSGSGGSVVFYESNKVGNTPASLFKGTASVDHIVELRIEDIDSVFYDRLLIDFDSNANAYRGHEDMVKFYNPELDFYTIMNDSVTRLAIDVRPFEADKEIPLGIVTYKQRRLVIKAPQVTVPQGAKLYLHDKLLNKVSEIKDTSFEYWFDIDPTDSTTLGNHRFVINTRYTPPPTTVTKVNTIAKLKMHLYPNPATNDVTISFAGAENDAMVRIVNIAGKTVYQQTLAEGKDVVTVPVAQLPSGIYVAELITENGRAVEKMIKQ